MGVMRRDGGILGLAGGDGSWGMPCSGMSGRSGTLTADGRLARLDRLDRRDGG
jgi:hypothetical protein